LASNINFSVNLGLWQGSNIFSKTGPLKSVSVLHIFDMSCFSRDNLNFAWNIQQTAAQKDSLRSACICNKAILQPVVIQELLQPKKRYTKAEALGSAVYTNSPNMEEKMLWLLNIDEEQPTCPQLQQTRLCILGQGCPVRTEIARVLVSAFPPISRQ